MKRYRKKPVVIEAVQFTGTNEREIAEFAGESFELLFLGKRAIKTLEGYMKISVGDFIIKGVNGEFYPCKPDIFKKTYELAE